METTSTNQHTQYHTFSALKNDVLLLLRHNIEYLQDFLLRCPHALQAPCQMALEEQLAHLQRVHDATSLEQLWIDSEIPPSFLDSL